MALSCPPAILGGNSRRRPRCRSQKNRRRELPPTATDSLPPRRVTNHLMPTITRPPVPPDRLVVFPSDLGWMAVVVAGATVRQLTFGHPSAAAAARALDAKSPVVGQIKTDGCHAHTCVGMLRISRRFTCPRKRGHGTPPHRLTRLVRRLQAFASGRPDPLRDIPVDPGRLSAFRRRVLNQCRRIPYGSTMSYAELAAKAGSPRAARAVGNCMAANRTPLLVPCHRVVRSDRTARPVLRSRRGRHETPAFGPGIAELA